MADDGDQGALHTVVITAQGGCFGLGGVRAPPRNLAKSVLRRLAHAARHRDSHLRRRGRGREAPAYLVSRICPPRQFRTSSSRGTDPFSAPRVSSIFT
jgi:hypothetical protein